MSFFSYSCFHLYDFLIMTCISGTNGAGEYNPLSWNTVHNCTLHTDVHIHKPYYAPKHQSVLMCRNAIVNTFTSFMLRKYHRPKQSFINL